MRIRGNRIGIWLWLGLLFAVPLSAVSGDSLYAKSTPVLIRSPEDRALARDWSANVLPVPCEATDPVMVRRLYIDLAGRLPTPDEARAYVASKDPYKRELLVGTLLASDGFADFWTMHWSDALRVKSEFPINLWPNAVYGYHRRIRVFLSENEPYDHFVRSLLVAEGSNFRVAEVNFYRAMADRSPEGIAATVVETFLGRDFKTLPEAEKKRWTELFSRVRFKKTKEWKEEIVYWDLDGAASDPRLAVVNAVMSDPDFSRAAVSRIWGWLFGRGLLPEAVPENPVNPELLNLLAKKFEQSNYNFRLMCRTILNTAAYRAAPFGWHGAATAATHFASYPVRRLGAEVLDDAIRDLTGVPSSYSSVIPEPFTFLPSAQRSIAIADGSITSSFLILFGRPARDSGLPSERNNAVTSSQRLFLFNSGELYRKLSRIPQRSELKKLPFQEKLEAFYWLFYSRPPTKEEMRTIRNFYDRLPKGKAKWQFPHELCWILLNSKEFLYQH